MISPLKPICLLADSQLLFWRKGDTLFLQSVRDLLESESPKAAYIGASNDDRPEFYEIFEAAMDGIGIKERRMIPSIPANDDRSFLKTADLILLAGGDAEKGFRVLKRNGLADLIVRKYREGSCLIGISAGAAQLGLLSRSEDSYPPDSLITPLSLVPFVVGAHEEKEEWKNLKETLRAFGSACTGIGLPTGGGAVYHPNGLLEPVRHPVHEFLMNEGRLIHNLLFPPSDECVHEATGVC